MGAESSPQRTATVRGEPIEAPSTTPHVAVLLAAGASTRLGQPKQLLTRRGEPVVRHVARLLADTNPHQLLVVLGAHAREISAALGDIAYRAVINAGFADGLASSLHCAAAALGDTHAAVLVAACDQPALEGTHLAQLLALARQSPVHCAATRHGDRLGIPAVVPGHVFQKAIALRGDRGLGGWLSATEGVTELDAPALEFDIDTPKHLAAARARGWVD